MVWGGRASWRLEVKVVVAESALCLLEARRGSAVAAELALR